MFTHAYSAGMIIMAITTRTAKKCLERLLMSEKNILNVFFI